jgi:hypothetical protein
LLLFYLNVKREKMDKNNKKDLSEKQMVYQKTVSPKENSFSQSKTVFLILFCVLIIFLILFLTNTFDHVSTTGQGAIPISKGSKSSIANNVVVPDSMSQDDLYSQQPSQQVSDLVVPVERCPQCTNRTKDCGETGVDCGGPCPSCDNSNTLDNVVEPIPINDNSINISDNSVSVDISTSLLEQQCTNKEKDGDEIGIDCGGSCPVQDCCTNGEKDESLHVLINLPGNNSPISVILPPEEGVDCGGSCSSQCIVSQPMPKCDFFTIYTINDLNYIKINSCKCLQEIGKNANLSKNYILTNDIDCSDTINWDNGKGFKPIGNDANKFKGIFDGNGYTISNLYINRPIENYVGLFGYISDGNIYNLKIIDANINGNNYVGVLSGIANASNVATSTLKQIYISGNVKGNNYVGGLIGDINNYIVSCSSSYINIKGTDYVGGLFGNLSTSRISKSFSKPYVVAHYRQLPNTGNQQLPGKVSGREYVGGLIGSANKLQIDNSYSQIDVYGTKYVGRLIGSLTNGEISKCYFSGSLTSGDSDKSGLVHALTSSTVSNSFWVTTDATTSLTKEKGIGLTSQKMEEISTYSDSNWNISSNQNDLTTIWYMPTDGYPKLHWELSGICEPISPVITISDCNYNVCDHTLDSNGFYDINNCCCLQYIDNNLSGKYRLTQDINCLVTNTWNDGKGFKPIGDYNWGNEPTPFTGTFDGNGYTISNLYINRPDKEGVGLFGYILNGNINNVTIKDANIDGNNYVGVLAGIAIDANIKNIHTFGGVVSGNDVVGGIVGNAAYSNISCSSSSASVDGNDTVGGIAGYLIASNLFKSFSTSFVKGNYSVGGLVGFETFDENSNNSGSIVSDCYAEGNVSCDINYAGGLIGYLDSNSSSSSISSVSKSYSTGKIIGGATNKGGLVGYSKPSSIIEKSYWDINTSDQNLSPNFGALGKTTADMKKSTTYSNWSISTTSGDKSKIWYINQGNNYPRLQWEVGGLCIPQDHCSNGVMDEDETGKDCGGNDCIKCYSGSSGGNTQQLGISNLQTEVYTSPEFIITRKIYNYKYLDKKNIKTITKVDIDISPKQNVDISKIQKIVITDKVPKSFSVKASDISVPSNVDYRIIQDDPIVEYYTDPDGNINYSVSGDKNTMQLKDEFNSPIIDIVYVPSISVPTCWDGIQNQGETDVDCGGSNCPSCTAPATCWDRIQNQGETGVDCGGPCGSCGPYSSCHDGIKNQGETGVDCGGPCGSCPSCEDNVQNQGETGVDCGGPCGSCPSCEDNVQNQGETGVDCGGPCEPCINFNKIYWLIGIIVISAILGIVLSVSSKKKKSKKPKEPIPPVTSTPQEAQEALEAIKKGLEQ